MLTNELIKKQAKKPIIAGRKNETAVHFILLVSFFIVIQVVAQGQCIREKIIVHKAVTHVQPLDTNISLSSVSVVYSVRYPVDIYAIRIIGIKISLAGSASINASKITPSSPIIRPIGSKKSDVYFKSVISFTVIFASNQIRRPAGTANTIDLPKTEIVLSKTDRTIIFPT